MSICAANDSQHWTAAQSVDGSQVLVDGNGQCLDFTKKTGGSVELRTCTFKGPEHFLYSETGQIQSTNRKMCLQAAQAAQNAYVFIAKCKSGIPLQIWSIGH
jgi:hypothetical protein